MTRPKVTLRSLSVPCPLPIRSATTTGGGYLFFRPNHSLPRRGLNVSEPAGAQLPAAHRIPLVALGVNNYLGADMKPLPLLAALASLVACIDPVGAQQKVSAEAESGAAP